MPRPKETDPKPYLSASQLGMLENCGLAYEFSYLQKIKIPPSGAMVAGTGAHGAAEKDLRNKIATGELLSADEIPDLARDATITEMEESGFRIDKGETLDKAKGAAIDKAVRLAVLNHDDLAPKLDPSHVERRMRVKLDNYPYDLLGFVDVREKDGTIRDLKTSSKKKSQGDVDSSGQLSFYAAAALAVDGELPPRLAFDVLVDKRSPEVDTVYTTRTKDDVATLLRRIERASEVIEKGAFMPAPPDSWKCSEKWCGYFSMCPMVSRVNPKPSVT